MSIASVSCVGATSQVSRAYVLALLVLAALLVMDGDAPRAPSAFAAQPQMPAPVRPQPLGEEQIALHVRHFNAELTDREVRRIAAAVVKYSARYELDPALVLAVIRRESTARPWVRSPKGALGLMQVMPYMKGALPVAGHLGGIESNIEAGCMILSDNIRRLGESQGILAYFWGNDIRGVGYLERVEATRAQLLEQPEES